MPKVRRFIAVALVTAFLLGIGYAAPASDNYAAVPSDVRSYTAAASEFSQMSGGAEHPVSHDGQDGLVRFVDGGHAAYEFNIDVEGDYYLEIGYIPIAARSDAIELEIAYTTGGDSKSLGTVLLERPLLCGDITLDEFGDDVRARLTVDESQTSVTVRPRDGSANDAYTLRLERGVTQISITGRRTEFLLTHLTLVSAVLPPAYTPPTGSYASKGVKVQAENLYRVSSSTLTAQYDRSDAYVEPSDPTRMVLNIAGGENWRADGQWMEWQIYTPSDGLYALRIKARQNMKSGLASNRRLYVDGTVPCLEAYNMVFEYSSGWRVSTLQTAEGETILLPMDKGWHTLRLEVVPGEVAALAASARDLMGEMNRIYRSIVMVTGISPDRNREYYLEREIPNLIDDMASARDTVAALRAKALLIGGGKGDELAPLSNLEAQLDSFIRYSDTIQTRLGAFKGNIDALGIWILATAEQPLDLDYLMLDAPDADEGSANAGFLDNFIFGIKNLIASFDSKQPSEGARLRVWVSMGRDQMQIAKQLCDDLFTPATGITVDFSVMSQGVTEAVLAGSGPDVVLYCGSAEPVNLAMRGLLLPIDTLDGFDTIAGQLQQSSLVPYVYKDSVFGLPLTQSFPMLFYRTDILAELGIEPPTTWTELYGAIQVIQRKNMQVGIPSGEATFATLLFQNGGEYYNAERTATTFGGSTAVEVFRRYARFFSDYGLPLSYDFFNRFRSGEMPLGITDYTEYNRLRVAAPEISGLWAMSSLPGTERDGKIDRSAAASGGQGGYILGKTEQPEAAWEFLRWFASGEIQGEFGRRVEALLGAAGRYAPANRVAFGYLGWTADEAAILQTQWDCVRENPQLPGSYYTSRNLVGAFRAVVLNGANPREALLQYSSETDRELERKRVEYDAIHREVAK